MAATVAAAYRPMIRSRLRIPYGIAMAGVILLGALLLGLFFVHDIATWRFGDPDDLMRLQEVRDWMAGQSWFDVSQHRINPPVGLAMHWSRLLDVPLATVILLVRPFAGQTEAELWASILVPLATFAVMALLVATLARRLLANDRLALVAAFFCALDIGMFSIARPMRIDHHGWQAACGLGMVLTLIARPTARRAAIGGLCAAFWMHISLEGIVFTAGCGAWLGLRWAFTSGHERWALPAYLGGVALGSLGFFLIGHGGALFDRTACDAISPVHMTIFALATLGTGLAAWRNPATPMLRVASLGMTALLCGATYKLWAPQCAGGPFAALTPLTYRFWYLTVAEGLPVWKQPAATAIGWVAFPCIGIVGGLVALRAGSSSNSGSGSRGAILDYVVLLALATVMGAVVSRASGFANIVAVPGALMLIQAGLPIVSRVRSMPVRVLASAGLVLLLVPLTPAIAALLLFAPRHPPSLAARTLAQTGVGCIALDNVARLRALPPGLFMTTLDSSEALIVATAHRAVGAGYHRNVASMEDTIRFFTGDDAAAQVIVRRDGANYVFVCPGDGDAMKWAKASPYGLAARLTAGDAPVWLRPVQVPGLRFMRVYAVTG